MKFNIAGFTHKGTGIYQSNEDNMLLNGQLLNDGELVLLNQDYCNCFVSDGVGGNAGGDFASHFVLNKIKLLPDDKLSTLNSLLSEINIELLEAASGNYSQCACTLSGMIINEHVTDFFHIGDSEIWLLRDDMLMKISKDEVVDDDEVSSPLINYFGGGKNNLRPKTDWVKPEIYERDIFLLCSDGLFKALTTKLVKPILVSEKSMEEKILKLKENCLTLGSEDNVTAIIIEIEEMD